MRREAGLGEAVGRVYEAGEALIVRRLELGVAEARVFARGSLGLALAGIVALVGWLYFVAGTIDALAREYPRFAVEMSVGGVHMALACALFALLRRGVEKVGDPS